MSGHIILMIALWDASFSIIMSQFSVMSLCRCCPSGMHLSFALQLRVKLPHVSSTFITVRMAVPSQLFAVISLQLQFSLLFSPPSSSSVCVCVCVRRAAAAGSLFLGAGFSVCLQHSAQRAAFAPRFISNSGPFSQHFPPQLAAAFVRMVFQHPGGKIQSVPAHTIATSKNKTRLDHFELFCSTAFERY